MDDMAERRKHKRFIVIEGMSEQVELHFSAPLSGEPIMGQITDLSAGGIGLIIDEPLPESFIFSLYIRLRGVKPFETKGKVVRLVKKDKKYLAGVLFTEVEVADAKMLNQIAEDYDNCLKTRSGVDKNFCFKDCLFGTLCDKKPGAAKVSGTWEKSSQIDIKNMKKDTPSGPADQTAKVAADDINKALKSMLPSESPEPAKSEPPPQVKASPLDDTVRIKAPVKPVEPSSPPSPKPPEIAKSSLDATVKLDAPIKPAAPPPAQKPPDITKSSLDATVKLDAPIKPAAPPPAQKPPDITKSSLDATVKLDAPIKPAAPPPSPKPPEIAKSSLDATVKLDAPIKPAAPPPSPKPPEIAKSSLDATVKLDAPIKPAAPPPTPKPPDITKSSLDATVKLDAPIKPAAPPPPPVKDKPSQMPPADMPADVKLMVRKVSRKKLHPVYKVFLTLLFIAVVAFFSKNRITKLLVTNAEEKLLIPKNESAVNNFKIVLKYEPRNTAVRFRLAQTYIKMRMYDDADKEYKKILKIKPDMFQAMIELGMLNIKTGKIKEAINYLKTAKSVSPQSRDAKIYLGISYEKDKNYDEAISEFKNISPALESEEFPDDAYLSMGKVWGVKGFHKDAKLFLGKAKLQKVAIEYFESGIVANETDPDEAIFNFIKATVKKNDFLEAHEWLGLLYRRKGLYDSAVECYQNVLGINPKLARIHFSLSQLHALRDDKMNAIASLEKTVALDNSYIKLAKDSYEFRGLKNSYAFKKILKRR